MYPNGRVSMNDKRCFVHYNNNWPYWFRKQRPSDGLDNVVKTINSITHVAAFHGLLAILGIGFCMTGEQLRRDFDILMSGVNASIKNARGDGTNGVCFYMENQNDRSIVDARRRSSDRTGIKLAFDLIFPRTNRTILQPGNNLERHDTRLTDGGQEDARRR